MSCSLGRSLRDFMLHFYEPINDDDDDEGGGGGGGGGL